MSASWTTFLYEAANFLLLAALLGWLFFRPVREALERRRQELESEKRAAEDARAKAEQALQDARAKRAELEDSLRELRERVASDAEAESTRLAEAARKQAQREREALEREFIALRTENARALARDAAFAAREIVVRLLEEMKGAELDQTLLRAACRELEELRASGSLGNVVIESAAPLDRPALAAIAEAAGISPDTATHRVDPDLVVGVRVLTAKGLVDTSAAGLAAQAERVLVREIEREDADRG